MDVVCALINERVKTDHIFAVSCKLLFDDLYKNDKNIACAISFENMDDEECVHFLDSACMAVKGIPTFYIFATCKDEKQIEALPTLRQHIKFTTLYLEKGEMHYQQVTKMDLVEGSTQRGTVHTISMSKNPRISDMYFMAEKFLANVVYNINL